MFDQPLNVVMIVTCQQTTSKHAHVSLFSSDLTLAWDELHDDYTHEQLVRRVRRSRDDGAAEAIGLMLAWGLLPEERPTAVMETLYGTRGGRRQAARPAIDAAVARDTPPPPRA